MRILAEARDGAGCLGANRTMKSIRTLLNQGIVLLNNGVSSIRRSKVSGDETLVIIPRCLQHPQCHCDVMSNIDNCQRCGKCRMADFADLQKKWGFRAAVVNGGRQACEAANADGVRAIVAVACEKELAAGILSLPTRRIHAVRNIIRDAPCIHTDVAVEEVRRALEKIIREAA